ncbi:hypothetical protein [Brevibacterium siliguriense]|nr:hypothetical protein [Brevibacterium siliguriense]
MEIVVRVFIVDGVVITAEFYPVRKGAQGLIRDSIGTVECRYSKTGARAFSLQSDDAELKLRNDEERRFLFSRGFRWGPETPVNR